MSLFSCVETTIRPTPPYAALPCHSKAEGNESGHAASMEASSPHRKEYDSFGTSRLLSLPKELRLEIWAFVFTNRSILQPTLHIRRKPTRSWMPGEWSSTQPHNHCCVKKPEIKARFENTQHSPIHVNLLRTNRFIYEEALPLLYRSVMFHIHDIEGIFPIFLNSLSPLAKSHIRYVKLSLNESLSSDNSAFHWALTCAQVAGLGESLRKVEIQGELPLSGGVQKRRSILYSLVKIKTAKVFVPDHDAEYQQLLAEASKQLETRASIRRANAVAEKANQEASSSPRHGELWMLNEVQAHSSSVEETKQSGTDFEDWIMISTGARSSNHEKARIDSGSNDDDWNDTSSSVVEQDDPKHNEDDVAWEMVR